MKLIASSTNKECYVKGNPRNIVTGKNYLSFTRIVEAVKKARTNGQDVDLNKISLALVGKTMSLGFKITRIIGAGAIGTTFLAEDLSV